MAAETDKVWGMMEEINQVILGKEEFTWRLMAAVLAGGHVLLEDVPGVGKTTMALAFSKALGLRWNRVQFTPDVLPSDLTGFSVYRKEREEFVYQQGAVFCNLLLADEINRTSPKTQSALLEVMEEKQVTVDGVTRRVPDPFVVIATQNPAGAAGTQMLPEAQMDRFMISMSIGYPDFESEVAMARGENGTRRAEQIQAGTSPAGLKRLQESVGEIYLHDSIFKYIVKLITATRNHPSLESGASPRGTIALVKMAQASAWIKGKEFVTPKEVAEQFPCVVRHRLRLNVKSQMEHITRDDIIREILESVEKPDFRRKRHG